MKLRKTFESARVNQRERGAWVGHPRKKGGPVTHKTCFYLGFSSMDSNALQANPNRDWSTVLCKICDDSCQESLRTNRNCGRSFIPYSEAQTASIGNDAWMQMPCSAPRGRRTSTPRRSHVSLSPTRRSHAGAKQLRRTFAAGVEGTRNSRLNHTGGAVEHDARSGADIVFPLLVPPHRQPFGRVGLHQVTGLAAEASPVTAQRVALRLHCAAAPLRLTRPATGHGRSDLQARQRAGGLSNPLTHGQHRSYAALIKKQLAMFSFSLSDD